jgi:hypothetical protein
MNKTDKLKKFASFCLKEPVLKISLGKHSKIEYFVVQNFGYDGISIEKFATKKIADTEYKRQLELSHYDKGTILIEGIILKSSDMEQIF